MKKYGHPNDAQIVAPALTKEAVADHLKVARKEASEETSKDEKKDEE